LNGHFLLRSRLALAILLCAGTSAAAVTAPISAHLEAGFASTTIRPLEQQTASGASVCAGLSAPLRGSLRAGFEFSASFGGDLGATRFPEAPRAGDRTLMTFLLGIEARSRVHHNGPFAFLGAGVGHSTLSGALGVFAPPYDRWLVPYRDLSSLALGAGLGYRFASGPGPLGISLALRTHLLPHYGQVVAAATTATLGLAY
jgi:hypothetical protein